jgi:hypothetical protein
LALIADKIACSVVVSELFGHDDFDWQHGPPDVSCFWNPSVMKRERFVAYAQRWKTLRSQLSGISIKTRLDLPFLSASSTALFVAVPTSNEPGFVARQGEPTVGFGVIQNKNPSRRSL